MSFYIKKDLRLLKYNLDFPIQETAKKVIYKNYNASSYGSENIVFNCEIPKSGLLLDRMIFLKADIQIAMTYDNVTNTQYILNGGRCGLRSYPLLKSMREMKVNINNRSISLNIGDVLSALELYDIGVDDKRLVFSKCATYSANQSQRFRNIQGSNRTSFADYSSSIDNTVTQPFPFFIIDNIQEDTGVTQASALLQFETCEPIWLSPFYAGDPKKNNSAISGVNYLNFSFSFFDNAERRMFAIDAYPQQPAVTIPPTPWDPTIAGELTSSFSFVEAPQLLVQFIEPKTPVDLKAPMQFMNSSFISRIKTHSSELVEDTTAVISSDDIISGTVPDLVFVFARRSNSELQSSFFYPDCFFSIENIKLNWDNRVGIFGECTKQQLYDISLRHGLNTEWASFAGKKYNLNTAAAADYGKIASQFSASGSVFCFSPQDFGCEDIPGTMKNINFKIDATIKNIDTNNDPLNLLSIQPVLYVVYLVNNVLYFADGDSKSLGVTEKNLAEAKNIDQTHFQNGGFGKLESFYAS